MTNFAERKTVCSIDFISLGFSESNIWAEVSNQALHHSFDVLNPKIPESSLILHFNALICIKNDCKVNNFRRRGNCVFQLRSLMNIFSVIKHLISFHAVKQCDTTSFIYRDTPRRQLGRCFRKIQACLQMLVLEL